MILDFGILFAKKRTVIALSVDPFNVFDLTRLVLPFFFGSEKLLNSKIACVSGGAGQAFNLRNLMSCNLEL